MKKEKIIVCGLFLILLIGIGIGYIIGKVSYEAEKNKPSESKLKNVIIKKHNGEEYFILDGDYKGKYSLDIDYLPVCVDNLDQIQIENCVSEDEAKKFNKQGIYNYLEYESFMKKWGKNIEFQDKNKDYIIISYAVFGRQNIRVKVGDVITSGDKVKVYMYEKFTGLTSKTLDYILVIPIDKGYSDLEIVNLITKQEFKEIQKYGSVVDPNDIVEKKPIIYIYPEKEMKVNIKLGNSELLTTSYPKYNNGWEVIATPDGTLKYDNREYYGLYWEGKNHKAYVTNEGFIVEGKDVYSFLEEKLAILGLNEREANEFIIYWLPKMEQNKYNYIRFETKEEINNYMPLIITPTPKSIIRIVMDYKALEEKIDVKEQKLETPSRTGYTVVEWGGSEIR